MDPAYLDNGDANYLVHHNVVWNCSKGIQLNLPQTNTDVFNNTFWNNKNPMSEWGPDGTRMVNCRTWNNIQDFNNFIGNDQQNNLYTTKPCFINPDAGNFELTDSSAAIDFGKIILGITDNFVGRAPDAGAYEFGSSWSAGSTLKIPGFKDGLPASPTGFSAKVNLNQVILSWIGDSTNILGFAIDRKYGNGPFQQIGIVNPDVTSLIDSTIEPNTTYTYRLRAFNNFGSTMSLHFITLTTEGDGSSVLLEAEKFDEQSGIINNGTYIGGCDNGDYIIFRQIDFHDGFNFFTTRCTVPDGSAGQMVLIKIDGLNGSTIGSFKVQSTGGWNNFMEQSVSINEIKGVHDIYFVFSGTSGVGNFDWFLFSKNSSSSNQSMKVGKEVSLAQNFPNPFQNFTTIKYWLDRFTPVNIKVFDLYGHCIKEIIHSSQDEGPHTVSFNAGDFAGGIYFYELKTDNYSTERKMLLIK